MAATAESANIRVPQNLLARRTGTGRSSDAGREQARRTEKGCRFGAERWGRNTTDWRLARSLAERHAETHPWRMEPDYRADTPRWDALPLAPRTFTGWMRRSACGLGRHGWHCAGACDSPTHGISPGLRRQSGE